MDLENISIKTIFKYVFIVLTACLVYKIILGMIVYLFVYVGSLIFGVKFLDLKKNLSF